MAARQAANCSEVRDDKAGEAPLRSQRVGQQRSVGAAWDAVDLVVRAHYRARAGAHGGFEGREQRLVQFARAEVRGAGVVAAFGEAVAGEMFERRENGLAGVE